MDPRGASGRAQPGVRCPGEVSIPAGPESGQARLRCAADGDEFGPWVRTGQTVRTYALVQIRNRVRVMRHADHALCAANRARVAAEPGLVRGVRAAWA